MQIKFLLITFVALGSIELLSADGVKKAGSVSDFYYDKNKEQPFYKNPIRKKITLYNYYQYRTVKCQSTGHVIINDFMFTLSRQL